MGRGVDALSPHPYPDTLCCLRFNSRGSGDTDAAASVGSPAVKRRAAACSASAYPSLPKRRLAGDNRITMRHGLFTLAAALSLLLCMAAIILLIGSWSRGGRMFRISFPGAIRSDGTRTQYVIELYASRVGAGAVRVLTPPPPPVSLAWVNSRRVFIWRRAGIDLMFGENVSYGAHWQNRPPNFVAYDAMTDYVGCPLWMLIALGLPLPLIWLRRQLRLRWARQLIGCCKRCGYDLRATPSRCPECGWENEPTPVPVAEGRFRN